MGIYGDRGREGVSYHLHFILLEEYISLEIVESFINNIVVIIYITEGK